MSDREQVVINTLEELVELNQNWKPRAEIYVWDKFADSIFDKLENDKHPDHFFIMAFFNLVLFGMNYGAKNEGVENEDRYRYGRGAQIELVADNLDFINGRESRNCKRLLERLLPKAIAYVYGQEILTYNRFHYDSIKF